MSRINWDYEKVKTFVKENSDCHLLSTAYKNGREKLLFECGCGALFETNFESFRLNNKRKCNNCSLLLRAQKRSNSYEYVESYIAKNNCELLSKTYKNRREKLKIKCSCGNVFYTTFNNFTFGKQQCDPCGRSKMGVRKTYEEFKKELEGTDCELVSDYYINDRTKLKFKCSCGNIFERTPRVVLFQKSYLCMECIKESIRKQQMKTTEQFIEEVKTLVGEEYTVLGKYKGANKKIKIRHNSSVCDNYVFELAASSFLRGTRCPKCAIIKQTGEGHPRYNPNLTDEERKARRDLYNRVIREWRNKIFARDKYRCQICGNKKDDLNAHHLYSWHSHKEKRFELDNGITLCETHHKEFHSIYGYKNNTKEQFEEYKKKYKLSEHVI